MDKIKKYMPYIYIIFGISLFTIINNVGAISSLFGRLFSTISIFIYGIIISIFLNPLLEYLEKKSKLSRKKSIAVIYGTLILLLSLILFLGVPLFLNNIRNLTTEVPNYIEKLNILANKWAYKFKFFEKVNLAQELTDASKYILNNIEHILINSFGSLLKLFKFISNFLISTILSIFFLAKKEYFFELGKEIVSIYFNEKNADKIYFYGTKLNEVFLGWLHGKTIDSIIIGFLGFIILLIFKIPYAAFLAVAIYLTNYVPYIGPMVGIAICGLVTFFTAQDKLLWIFISLIVLQQFDAWYLEAKCFKKTLKLDLFWGIAAVLFGGSFGHPIWIILMIPTFAFIKDMYYLRKNEIEGD